MSSANLARARIRHCTLMFGLAVAASCCLSLRAHADCPAAPVSSDGRIEGLVTNSGRNASLAMDPTGRFVVVYESVPVSNKNFILIHRFDADGSCVCDEGDGCPSTLNENPLGGLTNEHPSVAIEFDPEASDAVMSTPGVAVELSGLLFDPIYVAKVLAVLSKASEGA